MHTTDSIDYVLVVSGEVTLDLDDGEETVLRAGDVVVQNGTRHAWRNAAPSRARSSASPSARTAPGPHSPGR